MMGFCEVADIESFLQIDIPAEKQQAAEDAITQITAASRITASRPSSRWRMTR
jgi:hypothetical protein